MKKTAETEDLSVSACLHKMIERGLNSDKLSAIYNMDGDIIGIHGMHNLTPTEPEGRVCIYIDDILLRAVVGCSQRFTELTNASLSGKVRCLVYAGIHQ